MNLNKLDPLEWDLDPGPREPLIFGVITAVGTTMIAFGLFVTEVPVTITSFFYSTVILFIGWVVGMMVYDTLQHHRWKKELDRKLGRIKEEDST